MKQDLDRRLVAVMFTDMVGYTALFQRDERLAMDKRDRYTSAVERHHEAFGGSCVATCGCTGESIEGRAERAAQIAAAAEVYADQEGIVNVYSDQTPGREFVDRARASLSEVVIIRATEMGRRLTIHQVLDLARAADASPGARA